MKLLQVDAEFCKKLLKDARRPLGRIRDEAHSVAGLHVGSPGEPDYKARAARCRRAVMLLGKLDALEAVLDWVQKHIEDGPA